MRVADGSFPKTRCAGGGLDRVTGIAVAVGAPHVQDLIDADPIGFELQGCVGPPESER